MITTHSKFLYGLTVTSTTRYIDFDDGSNTFAVTIAAGYKTPDDLISEIETAMNAVGSSVTFTVTYNRTTRIFTIAGNGNFSLLVSSGANEALGIYSVLGIATASDFTTVTSVVGATAVGTYYRTQFKLQDYVDAQNNVMNRYQQISKAANGKTKMISFGTDQVYEMSFKWLTDLKQPSSGAIRNVSTIADFRAFMTWAIDKKPFEFFPDEDDLTTYSKVILDSSAESQDGSGFKITPKYAQNLGYFYETGLMKMRIVP